MKITELTTQNNPGYATKYKTKNIKEVFSFILAKAKKRKLLGSFLAILSESENYWSNRNFFVEGKYFCPICERRAKAFVNRSNNLFLRRNSACPNCMCRARHRGLFFLYKDYLERLKDLNSETKILHFAPEPVFYNLFKKSESVKYFTADYFLKDVDYTNVDIQNVPFNDNEFDLILCNHVIEHVEKDDLALKELYRILKPGGKVLITIPGDYSKFETTYFNTLENNGHYRHYGLDFIDKMQLFFDECKIEHLNKYNNVDKYVLAIPKNELCFVGIKHNPTGSSN